MEKKDRPRFLSVMNRMRLMLPGPNLNNKEKAIRIDGFWDGLSQYGIREVEAAFALCVKELKFLPVLSEVLERIRDAKKEKYLTRSQREKKRLKDKCLAFIISISPFQRFLVKFW